MCRSDLYTIAFGTPRIGNKFICRLLQAAIYSISYTGDMILPKMMHRMTFTKQFSVLMAPLSLFHAKVFSPQPIGIFF